MIYKMSIIKSNIKLGNKFFKYRTYIPFLFILPLLIISYIKPQFFFTTNNNWLVLCFFVTFIGQCIRMFTLGYTPKGTSGRNTGRQLANSLNTKGIYSIVRHPLYLGNYIIWLGLLLFFYNIHAIIYVTFCFYFYYHKIMLAEEDFLIKKFKNEYIDWASKVPTFLPNIFKYEKTKSKFNLKKVLFREYLNITAIFISYASISVYTHHITKKENFIYINLNYVILFILLFFFIIRFFKKIKR